MGGTVPTGVALTSDASPHDVHTPVTFTAKITASNGKVPTGSVAFKTDSSQGVATLNAGTASWTTSLASGSHLVYGIYQGTEVYDASSTYIFQIMSSTTAPTISPVAKTYNKAITVTIAGPSGSTVYYTTNGSTPTTSSAVYTAPFVVSKSATIKALATAPGRANSPVTTVTYVIELPASTPAFSPAAGTYSSARIVSIVDSTAGATIYYTLNGTTPTTASTVYSGPITVSASATVKAIAVKTGYLNSAVGSAAYVIK
jgi:hypothetical protein